MSWYICDSNSESLLEKRERDITFDPLLVRWFCKAQAMNRPFQSTNGWNMQERIDAKGDWTKRRERESIEKKEDWEWEGKGVETSNEWLKILMKWKLKYKPSAVEVKRDLVLVSRIEAQRSVEQCMIVGYTTGLSCHWAIRHSGLKEAAAKMLIN